jgi:uncharacterized protein (TIGR02001 family)
MHHLTKPLSLSILISSSLLAVPSAMAELSGNVGFSSNYLWRGVTQSNDLSAISGGIDYSEGGLYAGTWTSSLGGGDYELDLYAGYGGEMDSISYDVGIISYQYPVGETSFEEAYVNGSVGMIDVGLAYTFGADGVGTEGDLYLSVGANTSVGNDVGVGLTYGSYDFDTGTDYTHFAVTLSKGDFAFGIEKNDMSGGDQARVVASWSQSFEL